ncbi:hypothetical protein OYC64_020633 [Pagothenia borchgrevinki]|uniref:Uncharacterized protein n=1 Tax=Pagothenia borchgrevinki TaxID=8213 RepID=A0ABD2FN59_PAGBO
MQCCAYFQLTKNITFCRKRPVSCHKMCCSRAVLCILPTEPADRRTLTLCRKKTCELPKMCCSHAVL